MSSIVKKIVACELVTGRLRFGQTFEFRPRAFHVFAGNELPETRDRSGAVDRRVLVVQFDRSLGDDEVDGTFLRKVKEELPGVVAWAAEGLKRAMEQGRLTVPAGHKEALVHMQHRGDGVATFAHLKLEKAPGSRVKTSDLKEALRAYARESHLDVVHIASDGAMRKMSSMIEALYGGKRSTTNNNPYYEGVRLIAGSDGGQPDGPASAVSDDLAGL
jgi:phage/plasmid-associated DNA primase